jgi:hypothetical protein
LQCFYFFTQGRIETQLRILWILYRAWKPFLHVYIPYKLLH